MRLHQRRGRPLQPAALGGLYERPPRLGGGRVNRGGEHHPSQRGHEHRNQDDAEHQRDPASHPAAFDSGCVGRRARLSPHTRAHTARTIAARGRNETTRCSPDAAHRCVHCVEFACAKKSEKEISCPLTQNKVFTPAFAASGERAVSQHTRASSAATRWKAGYAKKVPWPKPNQNQISVAKSGVLRLTTASPDRQPHPRIQS